MKWFRFYSEVLNDPKILRLSDKEFRAWVLMLCIAAENDGRINPDDLGLRLRMPQVKAESLLDSLNTRELILQTTMGWCVPHKWNQRQYKSDVSTTRVKRFRERSGNVSETPPDTDTETETEQSQKQNRAEADRVPLVRLFERAFARLMSPMEIEQIHALEEEHPYERIEYGIREASDLNKRNVRYIQRICERQANGDTNGTDGSKQTARDDPSGVVIGVSNLERLRAAVAARERGS